MCIRSVPRELFFRIIDSMCGDTVGLCALAVTCKRFYARTAVDRHGKSLAWFAAREGNVNFLARCAPGNRDPALMVIAASRGHQHTFRWLCHNNKYVLSRGGRYYKRLLEAAIAGGNAEIVQFILAGCPIDTFEWKRLIAAGEYASCKLLYSQGIYGELTRELVRYARNRLHECVVDAIIAGATWTGCCCLVRAIDIRRIIWLIGGS
jgi:hypothetical protein